MTNPSILVVDDELLIRDLLYDFFQGQGWNITVAASGVNALKILSEKEFDVVLTDLKMPEMGGIELTNQLRESHPDLPVVIMTGYPSLETAIDAIRCKVADYIVKPFNINKLYKSVQSQIGEKNSH